MKIISFLICLALCANVYANVSASGMPAIDTLAPSHFAQLVAHSNYVVIPVYDSKSRSMGQPVIVREHVKLDRFAEILSRAIYLPTSHVFAVLVGGPITFYGKDEQRVLTLEVFGRILRLNGKDYELDVKSADAIAEWLKENRG